MMIFQPEMFGHLGAIPSTKHHVLVTSQGVVKTMRLNDVLAWKTLNLEQGTFPTVMLYYG